ncbi:MAG: M1 family aminopeptidase [Candidatus Omnitrophota bacterium]
MKRNAGILFLCGAWLLCLQGRVFAFEDIRYDLKGRLDPETKTITAEETLSFTNDTGESLPEIYLRVYPNHDYSRKEILSLYKYGSYFKINPFPGGVDKGSFSLKGVQQETASGPQALACQIEGEDKTVLKVSLKQPLGHGESITLSLSFTARVPHRYGRYGWHEGTFALNRWYPVLSVYLNKQWVNHPDYLLHMPYVSDAAVYQLSLDVPREYVVATGCDVVARSPSSDGWDRVQASSSAPLRELSVAVSRDYGVVEARHGEVLIKSYYLPKDREQAVKAAGFAADLIKFYGRLFGPYPYKEFSIVPVFLGYGGSQNAGMIFVDSRLYEMPSFLDRYFDFLVSHETGHQWWYNVVGNDEFRHLWLDEGINSYGILRYINDKYGANARIIDAPEWVRVFIPIPSFNDARTYRWWYFAKKGLDQPVISDVSSFFEPSLIFTVAYGKGSSVVAMLSDYLGPERFEELMRRYYRDHEFKTADLADFMRTANEVSGEDLGWFFRQWLYKEGGTKYSLERKGKDLVLKRGNDIIMPLKVAMEFKDGTRDVVTLDGKAEEQVVPVPEGRTLKSARLDEDARLLDVDKVDDSWPRKVNARLVPFYHPLYDIPLFIPNDAYSWITGPSFSKYGVGLKSSFQRPGDYILFAASHYDFHSESVKSSFGFEKNNLFGSYVSWGFELLHQNALTEKEDDLLSYKVYLRRELALAYSLFETNSHVTLYLLHNQARGKTGFLGTREEADGLHYRQKKETIVGATYEAVNGGAFPDPSHGYKLNATQEVGGHILGGDDSFSRTSLEWDKYMEIKNGHKVAFRLKGGYGYPDDKYLFYLGSDTELRGYDYKSVQGSSVLLGSLEYRFPLARSLDVEFPYRVASLDEVQGVVFFDAGSAWYDDFNEPGFQKDVGFGLRFYFNIAGAAERFALRIDTAFPLDGDKKAAHVWVGLNQAF